jgi:hypothetical protein
VQQLVAEEFEGLPLDVDTEQEANIILPILKDNSCCIHEGYVTKQILFLSVLSVIISFVVNRHSILRYLTVKLKLENHWYPKEPYPRSKIVSFTV